MLKVFISIASNLHFINRIQLKYSTPQATTKPLFSPVIAQLRQSEHNFNHSNWNYLLNLISVELKSHFIIKSFLRWLFHVSTTQKKSKISPNHSAFIFHSQKDHMLNDCRRRSWPIRKRHNLCFLQLLCAAHPVSKAITW